MMGSPARPMRGNARWAQAGRAAGLVPLLPPLRLAQRLGAPVGEVEGRALRLLPRAQQLVGQMPVEVMEQRLAAQVSLAEAT